jgi:hypothetical protein
MDGEQLVWELRKGEAVLGRLVEYERDFPWINCCFEPTPAFEPYRALFDAEPDILADESSSTHGTPGTKRSRRWGWRS